jgi:hypothetical protein
MRYTYAYQGSGHPLLSWKHGPPRQTRAGDAVSLGSLGDPTLVLPAPGAPEPINGMGCSGAGYTAKCGCGCKLKPALEGIADSIGALPASVKIVGAVALAYLLHKQLKKR